jgi:hypothetical protein
MSLADSKAIDTPTSGLPPMGGEGAGDYILLAGLSMPIMKLFELLAQLQHYLATSLPPQSTDPQDIKSEGKEEESGSVGEKDQHSTGAAGIVPNPAGDGGLRSRTRMTVLGSYDCCVSGEELREWLLRHVSAPVSLYFLALTGLPSSRWKDLEMILREALKRVLRSSNGVLSDESALDGDGRMMRRHSITSRMRYVL